MSQQPPKLRRHKTGVWFCRWGGRDRYFTRNKAKSRQAYLKSLQEWAEWRSLREASRPACEGTQTVYELVKAFLQAKAAERGQETRRYYEKHLARFLRAYGAVRANLITPRHLQMLKEDMLKRYAPKTVNHDIGAIKTLLTWGMDFEYVPGIRLGGVRKLQLDPPPDKTRTHHEVCHMVEQADETMKPWLALNYLCCMRPSEVVRVAKRSGHWVAPGIHQIENKVGRRTGMLRHVVFSDEALTWLEKIEPRWSRLDSYSQAVRDKLGKGFGPGRLRHSGASHLLRAGAARADVDLILGHLPPRVSLIYAPIEWQPLREVAGLLTLQSSDG